MLGLLAGGHTVPGAETMYHALLLACEENQNICGSTLMNALYSGGETGTALNKQDYDAFQKSGQSIMGWISTHGNQLVLKNSMAVSAAVGGIRALDAEGWTRAGWWMSPTEYSNMADTGVVQWNAQGVSRVANPADPAAYRAAPPGDIYVEYEVPTSALSPHSAGTSIIYGPDSFVAKLPGHAQLGDVPVQNIMLPDEP